MNTANNYNKLAQLYADNEFTKEEKDAFCSKMLIDGELKLEVELHQRVNSIIKDSSLENMKSVMESAHQKYLKQNRSNRLGLFESKSVIAAASIIIGLLFTILFVNGEPENVRVFNEYYRPYEPTTINRNTKFISKEEILYTELIHSYASKDYRYVEVLIDKFVLKYELRPELELIEAITLIENKKFKQAKEKLRLFSQEKSHPYTTEAYWYLSLIEIFEGDIQDALAMMQEIEKHSVLNASMAKFKNELLKMH